MDVSYQAGRIINLVPMGTFPTKICPKVGETKKQKASSES